jgi:hypothetical protein
MHISHGVRLAARRTTVTKWSEDNKNPPFDIYISVMQVTAHDVRQKLFLHHDDAVGAGGKRRLAGH